MGKRTASYMDEMDRVSERIYSRYGSQINSRESFNNSFSRISQTPTEDMTEKQKNFRNEVFKIYLLRHQILRGKREDTGKYRQERDLRTYEKKEQERDIPARSGGSVVFASKQEIKIRNKKITVYRDSKGRFSSVK